MFEAKRMDDGNRFSGVRVVEETFDESTQETITRTIFRGGRAQNKAYKKDDRATPKKPAGTARGGGRARAGKSRKRAEKKSNGLTGPLIVLALLIIGGLAGMFALQKIFQLG
ncbi:MAG: hypothetical protein V3R85_12635 [Alphaproteobacteria bacterium]